MTDTTGAGFQREGQPAFEAENTEETTSAGSPPENENQEDDTQSPDGDNSQGAPKDPPFHEHPAWKEREESWTKRFNDQEVRHQTELTEAITGIRKEFGEARKQNAEATQIPAWFGGDQAQWDAYRADRDQELKTAEDRAYERLKSEGTQSQKAVEDATQWLQSEVSAIETDRSLNPAGTKIDAEKLFKVAFDNQLVDTQGRWNYRAAYRLMTAGSQAAPAPKPAATAKKREAAETTSEQRAETQPAPFKTSADFKGNKRPW